MRYSLQNLEKRFILYQDAESKINTGVMISWAVLGISAFLLHLLVIILIFPIKFLEEKLKGYFKRKNDLCCYFCHQPVGDSIIEGRISKISMLGNEYFYEGRAKMDFEKLDMHPLRCSKCLDDYLSFVTENDLIIDRCGTKPLKSVTFKDYDDM